MILTVVVHFIYLVHVCNNTVVHFLFFFRNAQNNVSEVKPWQRAAMFHFEVKIRINISAVMEGG